MATDSTLFNEVNEFLLRPLAVLETLAVDAGMAPPVDDDDVAVWTLDVDALVTLAAALASLTYETQDGDETALVRGAAALTTHDALWSVFTAERIVAALDVDGDAREGWALFVNRQLGVLPAYPPPFGVNRRHARALVKAAARFNLPRMYEYAQFLVGYVRAELAETSVVNLWIEALCTSAAFGQTRFFDERVCERDAMLGKSLLEGSVHFIAYKQGVSGTISRTFVRGLKRLADAHPALLDGASLVEHLFARLSGSRAIDAAKRTVEALCVFHAAGFDVSVVLDQDWLWRRVSDSPNKPRNEMLKWLVRTVSVDALVQRRVKIAQLARRHHEHTAGYCWACDAFDLVLRRLACDESH